MPSVVINETDTQQLRECLIADLKISANDRQRLINKLDRMEEKMVKFQTNKAIKIK